MIVFNLGCANNHRFEGWFASNEDFERQSESRLVTCPLCGNANVSRLPHAPHIGTGSKERPSATAAPAQPQQQYANVGKDLLARMVEQVLENTEDVGSDFPDEARRIHYQETEQRQIRGTASRDEVTELRDEGIEVVSLPFELPNRGKAH